VKTTATREATMPDPVMAALERLGDALEDLGRDLGGLEAALDPRAGLPPARPDLQVIQGGNAEKGGD
jgi:hypothetical protein